MRIHRAVRRLLPAALSLLLVVASGCVPTPPRNPFAAPGEATDEIRIYIENRGFTDVRVYAHTSRGQEFLGQLGANAHLTVDFAWRRSLDQISFRIEVVAGRTFTTNPLAVSSGQRVELIIPDDPARAIVRRG